MGWSGWERSLMTMAQEESTGPREIVGFGRVWIEIWKVEGGFVSLLSWGEGIESGFGCLDCVD